MAHKHIFENQPFPAVAVQQKQQADAVGCRAFFSGRFIMLVFDILQFPSGCVWMCTYLKTRGHMPPGVSEEKIRKTWPWLAGNSADTERALCERKSEGNWANTGCSAASSSTSDPDTARGAAGLLIAVTNLPFLSCSITLNIVTQRFSKIRFCIVFLRTCEVHRFPNALFPVNIF